jgi:amino acid transporter
VSLAAMVASLWVTRGDGQKYFSAALTVSIALIVLAYLLIYPAFLALRLRRPDLDRPFLAPGGRPGAWLITALATGWSLLVTPASSGPASAPPTPTPPTPPASRASASSSSSSSWPPSPRWSPPARSSASRVAVRRAEDRRARFRRGRGRIGWGRWLPTAARPRRR